MYFVEKKSVEKIILLNDNIFLDDHKFLNFKIILEKNHATHLKCYPV